MKKQLILLIFIPFLFSCSKTETVPDPTTYIVDKWWCAKKIDTYTIASQYFKADGTWEQGSKGGKFNDTGKWALSSNKKKIIISNVIDSNKKSKIGWEYDIESAATTNLIMNWAAFSVKMDMTPCI